MEKTIEYMVIGPEWARLMMDHPSSRNRKTRPTRVRRYAMAMLRGRWKRNGELIKIRTDGSVGDGWHRLLAVIEANRLIQEFDVNELLNPKTGPDRVRLLQIVRKARERLIEEGRTELTIPMDIMWGATEDDILTTDTGKSRTFGDVLAMEGEKWPPMLGGAVNILDMHLKGTWKDPYAREDNEELQNVFDEHRGIVNWLGIADKTFRSCKLSRGATVVGLYLISESHDDEDIVGKFAERLSTGTNLEEKNPILALRQWGITGAWRVPGDSRRSSKKALTGVVKAFNYWVTCRPLKLMKVLWDEDVPKVVTHGKREKE